MTDPLTQFGDNITGVWLAAKGEDRVRRYFQQQKLVFSQDRRQLVEWLVRGRYPIGIGVIPSILTMFKQQGLNIDHVKPLMDEDPASSRLTYANGAVALMEKAPNPNAAKLFINWLLSKEGQTLFAKRTGYNVRHVEVPVVSPTAVINPKVKYSDVTLETTYPIRDQARKVVQSALR
jgi:ABC-type Fe3+ transport system substrate-binding protein